MTAPEQILEFWLDQVGPKGWYLQDETLDQQIREQFLGAWEDACEGRYSMWLTYPSGALAYLILTDQFPRNMFREDPRAFAADAIACAVAKSAIKQEYDLKIDEPARQFFYLPLMHSENLEDQERCVRLLLERMPKFGPANLLHARAHREVIRAFGRFPYRNAALGRHSTAAEMDYVASGGYGSTVRVLQAAE
ncbi:Uncharacterized conserved protein, DUF924 family [Epibacterium ulvae]|uniref:Uncharacterized conserved protein, DUF924 family n=1 Tax=Epibacterium ulvae TaxID=1156985 RepID=A0A1G5RCB3_9RHOB|nr:DUF924 family protein [Epibacterium ulvae]SCZ71732.1 Uncharacterized conserved protein, DUF924 family [Epibacterium ulvae]